MHNKKNIRGYAVVELAIAATVLLFVVGGTCVFMSRAGESWNSVILRTGVQSTSRDAMNQVTKNLQIAGNIRVDESDPDFDSVLFQLPEVDKKGKVKWGAWEVDEKGKKKFKEDHWFQYAVVNTENSGKTEAQLVLQLLDKKKKVKKDRDILVTENVGTNKKGQKVFKVNKAGDLYSVQLQLMKHRKGKKADDSFNYFLESTVLARNVKMETSTTEETTTTDDDGDDGDDGDD